MFQWQGGKWNQSGQLKCVEHSGIYYRGYTQEEGTFLHRWWLSAMHVKREGRGGSMYVCTHIQVYTHTHIQGHFYRCNRYFTVPFSVSANSSFLTKHRSTAHSYLMLPLSIRCVWIVPPWLLCSTWTTDCTLFTMPSTTWNSTKSNTVYVVPVTMCQTCDNFFRCPW
jgi:hypothetical protein